MKRSHFLMIVLITVFISLGAVSCGVFGGEDPPAEEAPAEITEAVVVEEAAAPVVDEAAAPVVDEAAAPVDEAAAPVDEAAAPVDEAVAPVDEAATPAGGMENDDGVGGGAPTADQAAANPAVAEEAGDPTADQVAVDPNAGGGAVEAADAAVVTTDTTTETADTVTKPAAEPAVDITDCNPPNDPVTTGAYYIVQACDNLYRIGLSYGLSWTAIAQANGIYYPDRIWIGQRLLIPGQPVPPPPPPPPAACDSPPAPVPTGSYYVVQPCDNLFRIGLSYGLSWTVIAQANNIYYPNYILVGQTLYIPGQPAPAK